MFSTQQAILIEDIKDDLIFLKDGGASLILNTTAVNFGLLFETEQMAIIDAFAQLLNSLSFPIQIVIRSKKMDISSYLSTLERALKSQTNQLLAQLTLDYRNFVEGLIKENDVLDKQFYVCLYVSAIEMGILPKQQTDRSRKAKAMLETRRDLILRQLNRIGLKARQLATAELINLFYDIYNPDNWYFSTDDESVVDPEAERKENELQTSTPNIPSQLKRIVPQTPIVQHTLQSNLQLRPIPQLVQHQSHLEPRSPLQQNSTPLSQNNPQATNIFQKPQIPFQIPVNGPTVNPLPPIKQNPPNSQQPSQNNSINRASPFIVEELKDDFGS